MPNRILDGNRKLNRTHGNKPVIGFLMTVILAVAIYLDGNRAWEDPLAAFLIAFSFTVSTLIVAIFTEMWTWRATGVLISLAGTAIIYWIILAGALGWVDPNPLLTRSILRASLTVGGTLLLLGIVQWAKERRAGSRPSSFTLLDPPHEAPL